MNRLFIFLLYTMATANAFGQYRDTLRIDDCLSAAVERSPVARQLSISDQVLSARLKNLGTNWLPAVSLNAQASYNSETVDFSDVMQNLPVSVPSLPLDQYKLWADINQQIYDGGSSKALKLIEKAAHNADIRQTESELLSLRIQVSQVFFSLLLNEKSSEILEVALRDLLTRKNMVKSLVDNGVVLPENLLALEAEELSFRQKLTGLNLTKDRLFTVLSILTNSTYRHDMVIAEPEIPAGNESGVRPEFLLFDQQELRLQASQKLVSAGDMPKLFAFSQLAYGRPGYNIVSRDFHTFYTVGAGFKWNFLNYGDSKRQQKVFGLQKELVDVKRRNFSDQLEIQLQAEKTDMEKYDSLMKQDEQILLIRKSIAESSLSRLNNGVITSADYLRDMNAEILATLQLENHKILRKQAVYNYLLLQGKL